MIKIFKININRYKAVVKSCTWREDNSIFWDIGANIGTFSIYAGKRGGGGIKVFSFEPAAGNFYNLNKNIDINKLDNTITAFCLAISDKISAGTLNLSDQSIGGAIHQYGDYCKNFSFNNRLFNVIMCQGAISFSIDKVIEVFNLDIPNYIKIDVDGIEDRIIESSPNVLKNKRVKEVLVELDEADIDYVKFVENKMVEYGFHLKNKQILYGSVGNFIFTRKYD